MMDESCFWVGAVAGTATWMACGLFWKWVDQVRRSRRRKPDPGLKMVSTNEAFQMLNKAVEDGYVLQLMGSDVVIDHDQKIITVLPSISQFDRQ